MQPVYVHGIGVATPGMTDWESARAVLAGDTPFAPAPLAPYRTGLLPRNEARRAGASVGLAFQVAEQACAGVDARGMASVFASSTGDSHIADKMCQALAVSPRSVSPTQFHNSVHNAAAGYWSIATGSQQPATSLSAGIDSFTAGLCEAWAMLADTSAPVLLVGFDAVGSGMLYDSRPSMHATCALALVLSPQKQGASACLRALTSTQAAHTAMANPELEQVRRYNSSGRGLALLAALAGAQPAQVVLESSQGNVALEIEPLP